MAKELAGINLKMIMCLRLPRWNDVLLAIYKTRKENRYCERLNRNLKASRTHIRQIVKLLAQHNLIEIIETKKIKRLAITERGRKVIVAILQIRSELSRL